MSVHPRRPLPTSATRLVHSSLLARTSDYEDHTFSGIIFILQVNSLLPIDFVEIHSVFVRGQMGQMSVYSTQDQVENSQIDTLLGESLGKPEKWQTHFGPYEIQNRYPALNVELELDVPIRICNGCSVAIYVHSETAGDMAIVYDQQRRVCGYKDDIIRILPGISHTSNIPHSNINHWGRMAWRGGRSFVGQIKYGAKHLLWTPPSQSMFSQQFNRGRI
ncbi:hypothetical protein BASA81_008383 [Batrachochytrium salamandrivorans]|nr:hypothetical protein BASA81_008383 [Batrachochytrium salamandrivorans]